MDWMEVLKFAAKLISLLLIIIPMVVELVKYVKLAVKEKNWGIVLKEVMKLMGVAETKFSEGAERKEWVLAMLKAGSDSINYDIDYNVVSELIDDLCTLSKVINPATPAIEEAGE